MENPSQKLNLLNKTNFGAAIRELRKSQGLKAYELAEKVGIERTYITYIEKHNRLPSFFVMKKISDLLCRPELLRVYIKIKCSSLCEGEEVADEILKQGIQELPNGILVRNSSSTETNQQYLLKIKFEEGDAVMKMFGNSLICHAILISFKNEIKGINPDSKIMGITNSGILFILRDHCNQEPPNLGYYFMFVSWRDINSICPYITA